MKQANIEHFYSRKEKKVKFLTRFLWRTFDNPERLLETKNKIPFDSDKTGWNKENYREKKTLSQLLKQHQEYSLRCGFIPRLNRYFSVLDFDFNNKEKYPEWLRKRLNRNFLFLVKKYLRASCVQTKNGFHIYCLSKEPLVSQALYHWYDVKNKKQKNIGSLRAQGHYVVGVGSKEKEFVPISKKLFWRVKNGQEIKEKLAKFFFLIQQTSEIGGQKGMRQLDFKTQGEEITLEVKQILSVKTITCQKRADELKQVTYHNLAGRKEYLIFDSYRHESDQFSDTEIKEQLSQNKSLNLKKGWKYVFLNK